MTLDREAIKARVEAATRGPWVSPWDDPDPDAAALRTEDGLEVVGVLQYDAHPYLAVLAADADFIAHAREDVPKLIAEVERLESYIAAIFNHGMTVWSDTSCGRGGAGGQMITTTSHPEVIQHLVSAATGPLLDRR